MKLLDKRNEKMYKEFEAYFNNDGLRMDVIYKKLSEKYYLGVSRIAKIIVEQAKKIRDKKSLLNNKESINN
jgi:N-glycosylase/DNA lyase